MQKISHSLVRTVVEHDRVAAESWREDLRYMADKLPKLHANLFHTMTCEQFGNAVENLYRRIPSLARHEIIVELARIVAMVGDGHTGVRLATDPKIGFRRYPLRLYLYKDGLFVQAVDREYAYAAGARIVKIGNSGADQAYHAVRGLIPRDNEMTIKDRAPSLMVIPEVLNALGVIDNIEKAQFVVERQGQQKTMELKIKEGTNANWVDARDGAPAPIPLWLRDPENKFWFEYVDDVGTFYVQYNQCTDKDDETVASFFKRVFESAESHALERFILDLRMNRGGDNYLNLPIIHGLIRSDKINQQGKLFTIIGRRTFSAGQNCVNDLEKHTNTLFVGEPTGGKPNHFGDAAEILLPNSGIAVRASTLWWQDKDPRDMRPWTSPHIVAELTSEDYRTNNDPAMKVALST